MSTPVIRQAVGAATSGTNATATLGAGTAIGDLLVIFHGNDWNTLSGLNTPTSSQTLNSMTLQGTADAGSNACHVKVWTAIVTVGGSQTVTCNVTPSGEEVGCHVVVIDGTTVDTSSSAAFLDGTPAGNFSTTSTTPWIAPAITTSTSDALLLCFAVADGTTGTPCSFTPPSGMTEQTDVTDGAFSGSSVASLVLTSSGSTGTKSFTPSRSSGYAAASIALKGAAAAVADVPAPYEPGIPPGFIAPNGGFRNIPAIDVPVGVNVTDGTGPNHSVIAGDVGVTQTTTDGGNPQHTFATGNVVFGLGQTDTNPSNTHTTYDATTSTAVLVNVNAELTNHAVAAGDPSESITITADIANHSQIAGDALAGVGASAGTGTTSHTTGDALGGVGATDPTGGSNTHTTSAPAPGVAINAVDAANTHQTFDATISTAVILNVNAPAADNQHITASPTIEIDTPAGAPAATHQTFDAIASTTLTVTDGTAPANAHTTPAATAGLGGQPTSALHSFTTSDVSNAMGAPIGAPSIGHSTFDAIALTHLAPPAFVGVEAGSSWVSGDIGTTTTGTSESATSVSGIVG